MSPLARVGTALVRTYQLVVSPWVTVTCKYYPSCSAYALDAIRTHGALRGTRLALWRFLRCNPWSSGGVDHVPARRADAAPSLGAPSSRSSAVHAHTMRAERT